MVTTVSNFFNRQYDNTKLLKSLREYISNISDKFIIHDEYGEYKIEFEYKKDNGELFIITGYLKNKYININIDEFDIVLSDDAHTNLLGEFFNGNYKIVDYYYNEKELYTEFIWDNMPSYNIKENILYRYPYLLNIKEKWKNDGKLKMKIRYKKTSLL
jgi:hypothetical protein